MTKAKMAKKFEQRIPPDPIRERYQGCLLGGAVGDALGAPVEFMRRSEILKACGPKGITDLVPAYGKLGAITDDTQMTLFTAEGALRAFVRATLRGICSPGSVFTMPTCVGCTPKASMNHVTGNSCSVAG